MSNGLAQHRPPAGRAMGAMVVALFFGSGAMALIYQAGWIRLFGLHLGSTALAVSIVVAVFMGGLAIGSAMVGRRADRWPNPLTRYGYIEAMIGVYACLSPMLFEWLMTMSVRSVLGLNLLENFGLLTVLRFALTTLLLIGPTVLMGATLPLLSRYWAMRMGDGARGAGILYGLNTLGAFCGVMIAGFWLLPTIGMSLTIQYTALANFVLAIIAIKIGRVTEDAAPIAPSTATSAAPTNDAATVAGPGAALHLAIGLTGFAFMVCEIAWTRVLILVLGGSIYAVYIVLATVLAGLGLGAAAAASVLRAAPRRARTIFFALALTSAVFVCASAATFEYLPGLFMDLFNQWRLHEKFANVLAVQFVICGIVIFLPVFFMGCLFPIAAKVAVDRDDRTGVRIGHLYAANTIGDIVGSLAAGLLLIPLLGIRGSLMAAAAAQCIAAPLVAARDLSTPMRLRLAGGAVVVLVLCVTLTPPWQHQLMSSGIYMEALYNKLTGSVVSGSEIREHLSREHALVHYQDGLTATVTVTRAAATADLSIRVNGKVDGGNGGDMVTQRLSAHIPLLLHPNPKQVCVIGMGTGCTAGSAALYPSVEKVSLVEIEQAVVDAARNFAIDNYYVHDHPKVNIHVTDGRFFLRLNPQRFDVIISEPSNPWQAGNADMFTLQTFRLGAAALRPGGLFLQWIQFYSLAPENLQIVLRTFSQAFPTMYVTMVRGGDVLLIGSAEPFLLNLNRIEQMLSTHAEIAADITDPRVGVNNLAELMGNFRVGPNRIANLAGAGALHTDDLPVIAYAGPKDLYTPSFFGSFRLMAQHADGCAPYIALWPDPTPEGKAEFLTALAAEYRRRAAESWGEDSGEAAVTEAILKQIGPSTLGPPIPPAPQP